MHERIRCHVVDGVRDIAHRLDRSELVVDRHHRNNLGRRSHVLHHCIDVHNPVYVRRRDDGPLTLGRFEDRWMLGRPNDDRARAMPAPDGQVVRLGSTTGKDHFAAFEAGRLCDHRTGFIEGLTGATTSPMRCRWVGMLLGKPRHHRLQRLGAHGRRRSMIEIRTHLTRLRPQLPYRNSKIPAALSSTNLQNFGYSMASSARPPSRA